MMGPDRKVTLAFGVTIMALSLVPLGCGEDDGQSVRRPPSRTSRRIIRIEELTGDAFQLREVALTDYNYGAKPRTDLDTVAAPDSVTASKARALLTWLVSLERVRERDRSVISDMGEPQRSVALISKAKNEPSYRINIFGPKDAFGPTEYPIEIQVCDPACEWVRTVISDSEIEKRVDDLFNEAFRKKVGSSREFSPELNGPKQTVEPGKRGH